MSFAHSDWTVVIVGLIAAGSDWTTGEIDCSLVAAGHELDCWAVAGNCGNCIAMDYFQDKLHQVVAGEKGLVRV